jgi:hypothetical protein
MLKYAYEHYAEYAQWISSSKHQEAYWYLVGFAACHKDYLCWVYDKGVKKSF